MTLQERFEDKFIPEPNSGCWLWTASQVMGYGCIRIDKKTFLSHRISFELYNGPIGDGLHVLHRCDTRDCVNPRHLFLGTNLDNIQDSVKKGRRKGITRNRPSGLKYDLSNPSRFTNGYVKIKPEERDSVREARRAGGKLKDIAAKYGVSESRICEICHE